MKILVASDKFKGSLTAPEACEAIREGIESAQPAIHEIRILPISDGGDGLVETLLAARGGRRMTTSVSDALGSPVSATWGISADGSTAWMEMAEASGLVRLGTRPLDPWRASTEGTGELLAAAAEAGVERILLGIGGSATNDAGCGMARALGFRFLDETGAEVESLPRDLVRVDAVEAPAEPPLPAVTVACDVRNPLLGPRGCTRVYGPQKGIAESDFEAHEAGLEQLLSVLGPEARELANRPGAGAAGGLGFGCLHFLGADLKPGFDLVAEATGLDEAIAWADLVITGEGRIDVQSLEGKAPHGVAERARLAGKDRAAFCGSLGDGDGLEEVFGPIREIGDLELSLEENLRRGREHLVAAAAKAFG